MSPFADWIAVDWGTSNLRLWAIDAQGQVKIERSSDQGMGRLTPDQFEPVLLGLCDGLLDPARVTPVLICGMAGARQGWAEAPYVSVPVTLSALGAGGVTPLVTSPLIAVRILPGLSQATPADVMRGEETQIAGFAALHPEFDGTLCLPGTHSKWALLEDGIIRDFHTYMTGELFDVLRRHSILGTTIEHAVWSDAGFEKGLAASRSDAGLLAHLFTVRAGTLLETLPVEESGSYLSGLLIGSEVASATRDLATGSEVCIIGNPDLTDLYTPAVARHGIRCRQLGEYTGAHGLFRLAKGLRKRL